MLGGTLLLLLFCLQVPPSESTHCDVCVNGAQYCDATWLPYPNMNRAMLGINIAKKHPMPTNAEEDQSFTSTIFNAVYRNTELGGMEPHTFIHATDNLRCSAGFEENSWEDMKSYLKGSAESSMSSWNLGYEGPTITAGVEKGPLSVSATFPPNTASYGQSNQDSSASIRKFFELERGSISRSRAQCSVYDINDIDINEPSLSFHPSFIEAIKRLDKAKTPKDKRAEMENFIHRFGSHYARKTVMGIGIEFETRYTEKEKLTHNSETRKKCNSESGGFSLFGYKAGGSSSDCTDTLSNTTIGGGRTVKRFVSTTYGTLPVGTSSLSDWTSLVKDMMEAGTLQPVPIRQDLQPILYLFNTASVSAITHNDGTKVNVTNILSTAIDGYAHFCTSFSCEIPACAAEVRLDGKLYREVNGPLIKGRRVLKNEYGDDYLFYDSAEKRWKISTNFEEEGVLKSAICPQLNARFTSIQSEYPAIPNIKSWKECSKMCLETTSCKFWQYEADTNICFLVSDFHSTVASTSLVYTGSRDCPGIKTKFAYGLCVENNPSLSMWVKQGNKFFEKGLRIDEFDSTSAIITGGTNLRSSEMLGEQRCHVQELPHGWNEGHMLVVTAGDNLLLSCGGTQSYYSQQCLALDKLTGRWVRHSWLIQERKFSTAVTVGPGHSPRPGMGPFQGVWIFGPGTSSEFLPSGSKTWKRGPDVPGQGISNACGLYIGLNRIILIGGKQHPDRVLRYRMFNCFDCIVDMAPRTRLKQGRWGHSCALINRNIVVAGGTNGRGEILNTEIIPLDSIGSSDGRTVTGHQSQVARFSGLVTIGGRQPRLLALGGINTQGTPLASVKEWDEEEEAWKDSPLTLKTARQKFGLLAVPSSVVCRSI